jgi:plastocyanin
MSSKKLILGGLLACFLLGSEAAQAQEVRGRVLWQGALPQPKRLTLAAKGRDHPTLGCGSEKVSRELEVDPSGGIKNVVLWVEAEGPPSETPRADPVVLDQKGCEFSPHLVLVMPGGRLLIRNSDPTRHNLRIFEGAKMLMHTWQAAGASDVAWDFQRPGRYLVRCGVHPWMHAWVVAAAHGRYAATDSKGRYTISGLPEGTYTLHGWHEVLGSRDMKLEVGRKLVEVPPLTFSHEGARINPGTLSLQED